MPAFRRRRTEADRCSGRRRVVYAVGFHENFTGSQRSLAVLISGLPPDIEAEMLVPGPGGAPDAFRRAGVPVTMIRAPRAVSRLGAGDPRLRRVQVALAIAVGVVPYWLRIVVHLFRRRPSLVHCNDLRALQLFGPPARVLRIPVVQHVRGTYPRRALFFVHWLVRRIPDEVIAVARSVADSLPEGRSATVVYNGAADGTGDGAGDAPAEVEQLRAAAASRGRQLFLIVTSSSFVPFKGLHHLAAAMPEIVRRAGEAGFEVHWAVLASAQSERRARYADDVRDQVAELGVTERVTFAGWQPDPHAWMRQASVVVLPTVDSESYTYRDGSTVLAEQTEGLPRTILDAFATGTPVVATEVAGVPELLGDSGAGLMVPPGDPDRLADAVSRLAEDPDLRATMAAAAAERVDAFSRERCVEATTAIYDRVTRRRVGAPLSPR